MKFDLLWPSLPFILKGVFVTLQYALLSVILGLILGGGLTLLKLSSHKILKGFAKFYTSLFRGTPLLVQLTFVYFATPQLIGYKITAFEAGIFTFSLNSAAYVSEILRAGIESIDPGQKEAALALGLPPSLIFRDIILPQALKNTLPALVNETVDLLKESTLVSVIGESDMLRRANMVAAEKYIYFEPLLVTALLYYGLVMIFSSFAKYLEKRLKQSD